MTPRLDALHRQLIEALEDVEFAGCWPESEHPCCPSCDSGHVTDKRHEPDCKLAAALRAARG